MNFDEADAPTGVPCAPCGVHLDGKNFLPGQNDGDVFALPAQQPGEMRDKRRHPPGAPALHGLYVMGNERHAMRPCRRHSALHASKGRTAPSMWPLY